jgi:hypothetical protein
MRSISAALLLLPGLALAADAPAPPPMVNAKVTFEVFAGDKVSVGRYEVMTVLDQAKAQIGLGGRNTTTGSPFVILSPEALTWNPQGFDTNFQASRGAGQTFTIDGRFSVSLVGLAKDQTTGPVYSLSQNFTVALQAGRPVVLATSRDRWVGPVRVEIRIDPEK